METPQRVLVVCAANVCRSPLAQRVLQAAGLPIEVTSAGLQALTGAPMCAVSAAELPLAERSAVLPPRMPLVEDPAADEVPVEDLPVNDLPAEHRPVAALRSEDAPADEGVAEDPNTANLPREESHGEGLPSQEAPPGDSPVVDPSGEDSTVAESLAEEPPREAPQAAEQPEDVSTHQRIAHVARQVDADAVRAADLVVAMEREQRGALVRAAPGSQAKVFTLREAATFAAALAERGATVPDVAAAARAMHGLRGLVTVPEWPAPPRRWFRRPPEPADPLTISDGHGAEEPEHRAAVQAVHAAADRLAISLRAILPAPRAPER